MRSENTTDKDLEHLQTLLVAKAAGDDFMKFLVRDIKIQS